MRILIADDDPVALDMLEYSLVKGGHEVVRATNGQQALDLVRADNIRVVISDWHMPILDGLGLCRAIRSMADVGYVYVILLTASDGNSAVEGLTAGADDLMRKPFNPAEVAVRVRTAERILSVETRDLAIFAMAKLAESRDPESGKHLERVRHYSRILAQDLSQQPKFAAVVDANYVRLIYLTSPLHDIGKVAIPDSVLLKPGKLSDREFGIMKLHTTFGAETLAASLKEHPEANFLLMAKEIAETHHERVDGSGYPNGLRGDAIPLCGRIVAVADVYDALTSRRPYKAAFAHEVAKSMILNDVGSHFDTDVIAAFMRCEEQFIATATKYAEATMMSVAA
jgi:putative two-component system response regulator